MLGNRSWMAAAGLATAVAGVSACGGSGSSGLQRGPSRAAVTTTFAAQPDTVITRAWEVLRADGVLARSFFREAGDTANVARMESDWVYVPNVMDAPTFGHLSEEEKWVKFLFWARPERGGTMLFMEVLYNPLSEPTEPVIWSRMRPVPRAHPAWSYAEQVMNGLSRRLEDS